MHYYILHLSRAQDFSAHQLSTDIGLFLPEIYLYSIATFSFGMGLGTSLPASTASPRPLSALASFQTTCSTTIFTTSSLLLQLQQGLLTSTALLLSLLDSAPHAS
jgi:hypothetical protein